MPAIRLGTCSPAACRDPQATLLKLERLARQAAVQQVDILLLPEAFLGSGYPRGEDFGCAVGSRSPAGREAFRDYFRRAVDFGDIVGDASEGGGAAWVERRCGAAAAGTAATSPSAAETTKPLLPGDGTRETLERIARETGVFIVSGAIERAGGSLYCAVVYVCPRRGIVGKRRKVQPTGSERLIWAAAGPGTLRAVSTEIRGVRINMAAAICWESYMPMLRQALYAQNINLYLAPTADGRDGWLSLLRTIGVEGRCFVLSSNMCTETSGPNRAGVVAAGAKKSSGPAPLTGYRRRSVVVPDEDGNEIALAAAAAPPFSAIKETAVITVPTAATTTTTARPTTSRGGSAIVDPYGEILAGPLWDDSESIVVASADFEDCIRGRLDLDVAGSYSRNDIFKLSVPGLDLSPLPY